ncbi:acyltransferase domain-containing protein [Anaerocolumna xylanovorans]|uniref:Uncharacterized protein n=1 Tax=Anaerocolumna xylanovorans DSM 12503 TaxID=1121345 RepID=A0A1M7Y9G1_9FIRM|nr:acyltransferase domain-containing protein [Anaerocolumna xylanovorans]SHO49168.1 hypothetical protein SAMN02745217_02160 [Anaerocolumna xylanovorans DSM 12503]
MILLKDICDGIKMPEEVTNIVLELEKELDMKALEPSVCKLYRRSLWQEGLGELRKVFGEDKNNYKMLTCMLVMGLDTYKKYKEKGISDKVFYDTFACFSRFVKEHMASYGSYGFDREWWTPRQLSMEEFRLGELEFEVEKWEGEDVISVHIPSDASITRENCVASYTWSKEFFKEYYPGFAYKYYICDSWMLSPGLKDVLPADSRILSFQKDFTITEWDKENPSYLEWVYKNSNLTLEELPENTSLQRNIKKHLKEGGKIGTAFGYIKADTEIK